MARQTLRARREEACGQEYGLVFLEFIDVRVSLRLIDEFGWRRKRLQRLYDNERRYLSDWIGRYAADGGRVKDAHHGYRAMTEHELTSNAIEITQDRLDQELAAVGFVYDPACLMPDKLKNGYRMSDQSRAAIRMMWYATNGGRAARLYLSSLMMYLHTECGFGEGRLHRVFDDVADAVKWYTERFFLGTQAGDDDIRRAIDDGHRRIENCGLELEEVPANDCVRIGRKSGTDDQAAKPAPDIMCTEEFEKYKQLLETTRKTKYTNCIVGENNTTEV